MVIPVTNASRFAGVAAPFCVVVVQDGGRAEIVEVDNVKAVNNEGTERRRLDRNNRTYIHSGGVFRPINIGTGITSRGFPQRQTQRSFQFD